MPSIYAHYRFGQQMRKRAPMQIKQRIDRYPALFLLGVHGPDILFYYWPLLPSTVSQKGHELHRTMGKTFFSQARAVLESIDNEKEREPYLSYLYGVLAHFILDATCHQTVFTASKRWGLAHTEIESELDRALLSHDGKIAHEQKLSGHLSSTKENSEVIRAFYPPLKAWQIRASLNGMILTHNLFLAPRPQKRILIYAGLMLMGQYHNLHGMVINYRENPQCKKVTRKLLGQYKQAFENGKSLFCEYEAYLRHEGKLSDFFYYDFESNYHG